MKNEIDINGKIFTEDDIKQLISLVNELLKTNEDQNAKLIAMNAKLQNEESKVRQLTMQLYSLMQNTNN